MTNTGKELERYVADAYRQMGAKVEHDVELDGNQIDVYVELETADRGLHRIAVEAKDYARPVGIKIVRDFKNTVACLRRERLIDKGVIVSTSGFSRQARNAVKNSDIRLLERADLEAMITGAKAKEPITPPVSQPPKPSLDIPETILIPAGPFCRGSPPGGPEPNETPRLKLDLSAYRIGRYPVTNAQYACFLAANPDHRLPHSDDKEHRPYNWNQKTRTYPDDKADHPIVLVSLQDAMDYCRWLSEITGQEYRLSREEEWEKAARGMWPDERNYPWGEWRDDYCNTQELGRCCTSAVHEFERTNQSPFGVVDMAGNVWEWTSSPYRPYPGSAYESSSSSGERNVVRGGSWGNFRDKARVSFRGRYEYDTRRPYLGFRIACDVAPSPQPQPLAGDAEIRTASPTLVQPRTLEAIKQEISEEMIDSAKLRQNIETHFDKDDMAILCHDLHLRYGNLSRPREDTTALQIVNHCEKRGRLVELLNYCQRKRSRVDWQSIVRKDSDK